VPLSICNLVKNILGNVFSIVSRNMNQLAFSSGLCNGNTANIRFSG
jgi:hypothetical protein